MPQKLVAPKRLKLEKIARLTLQEIRYITVVPVHKRKDTVPDMSAHHHSVVAHISFAMPLEFLS